MYTSPCKRLIKVLSCRAPLGSKICKGEDAGLIDKGYIEQRYSILVT